MWRFITGLFRIVNKASNAAEIIPRISPNLCSKSKLKINAIPATVIKLKKSSRAENCLFNKIGSKIAAKSPTVEYATSPTETFANFMLP